MLEFRLKFQCIVVLRVQCTLFQHCWTRRQAIIWTNDGYITDAYICHSASMSLYIEVSQTRHRFANDIFKFIFAKENGFIWIQIELNFIHKSLINNKPTFKFPTQRPMMRKAFRKIVVTSSWIEYGFSNTKCRTLHNNNCACSCDACVGKRSVDWFRSIASTFPYPIELHSINDLSKFTCFHSRNRSLLNVAEWLICVNKICHQWFR